MQIINNPPRSAWPKILERPSLASNDLLAVVADVFNAVKRDGDSAIQAYTAKFDKVEVPRIQVTETELNEASTLVNPALKEAINIAKQNIEKFHHAQRTAPVRVETMEGVTCWQEKRPIQKVGVYIPGGSAPLFSTVLMLVVPAVLAGCEEIVLCTPPNLEGKVHPAILYAAQVCGVTKVFKVGGIQAIAGMTFGTETIPQVYKLFGPGNQYVTAAKQLSTTYGTAIDMPAGPSEVLVVIDETAIPSFVAADLLSQAEHGADSQVVLISQSKAMLASVSAELERQIKVLPRKAIAEKALEYARFIFLEKKEDILAMINAYAPEHLIICSKEEAYFSQGVQNAGSVFLGNYTPESAGDYASGTNHTLPTNGYARQYSGVNLDSFMKSMTFQRISSEGLQAIGPAIEIMSKAEGLDAHKNAVTLRLEALKKTTL
ncbi:histidinol dehydrogenase [Flavobacteriaceae bacterium F08102]|nr:histidinol dehydrogenase [Flavobacteriaceae bacterium F08102]